MNEYAFEHNGIGYTPSGKLTLAAKRIPSHNAEVETAELAAIETGAPVVVYPKMDPDRNMVNRGYYGLARGIVTLWTGRLAGHVVSESTFRNPFGGTLTAYTWKDLNGKLWHGRGAGDGMSLISRRSKS